MESIFGFDQRIIGMVEKFTQNLQRMTGKNNFLVAKVFFVLSLIAPFLLWILLDQVTLLAAIVIASLNFYFARKDKKVALIFEPDLEERVLSDSANGLANYRKNDYQEITNRLSQYFLCIVAAALIPLLNFDLMREVIRAGFATQLLETIALIALACDPLPPGNSKIRNWINGIRAFFAKPATVPTQAFRL